MSHLRRHKHGQQNDYKPKNEFTPVRQSASTIHRVSNIEKFMRELEELIKRKLNPQSQIAFISGDMEQIIYLNTQVKTFGMHMTTTNSVGDNTIDQSMWTSSSPIDARVPIIPSSVSIDTDTSMLRQTPLAATYGKSPASGMKTPPQGGKWTLDILENATQKDIAQYCRYHQIPIEREGRLIPEGKIMLAATKHILEHTKLPFGLDSPTPAKSNKELDSTSEHEKMNVEEDIEEPPIPLDQLFSNSMFRGREQDAGYNTERIKALETARVKKEHQLGDKLEQIITQMEFAFWQEFQDRLRYHQAYQTHIFNNNVCEASDIIAQLYLFGTTSTVHDEDPEVRQIQQYCNNMIATSHMDPTDNIDSYNQKFRRLVRMCKYAKLQLTEADLIFHYINNLDTKIFIATKTQWLERTSPMRTCGSLNKVIETIQKYWDQKVSNHTFVKDRTTKTWGQPNTQVDHLTRDVEKLKRELKTHGSAVKPARKPTGHFDASAETPQQKTCKFWQQGNCKQGTKCKFAHSEDIAVSAVAKDDFHCPHCRRTHSTTFFCKQLQQAFMQHQDKANNKKSGGGKSSTHSVSKAQPHDSTRAAIQHKIAVLTSQLLTLDERDNRLSNYAEDSDLDSDEESINLISVQNINSEVDTATSILEDSGASTNVVSKALAQRFIQTKQVLPHPIKLRDFHNGVVEATQAGKLGNLSTFIITPGVNGAILSSGKVTQEGYKWFVDPKGRYKLLIDEGLNIVVLFFMRDAANQYRVDIQDLNRREVTLERFLKEFQRLFPQQDPDNELFKVATVFENNPKPRGESINAHTRQATRIANERNNPTPEAPQLPVCDPVQAKKRKTTRKEKPAAEPLPSTQMEPEQTATAAGKNNPAADPEQVRPTQTKKKKKPTLTPSNNNGAPNQQTDPNIDTSDPSAPAPAVVDTIPQETEAVKDDDEFDASTVPTTAATLLPPTRKQLLKFTAIELAWNKLGNVNIKTFKEMLQIYGSNLTPRDVDEYVLYAGPNSDAIRSRMKSLPKQKSDIQHSYRIGEVLDFDQTDMFGQQYLQVVDRESEYVWNIPLKDGNSDTLFNAFRVVKADLIKYGHAPPDAQHIIKSDNTNVISPINTRLTTDLRMITDPLASGHHSQRSEGKTAIVRPTIIAVKAGSHFPTLRNMQSYLVEHSTELLNLKPTVKRPHSSPYYIFTGKRVTMDNFKVPYGALVTYWETPDRRNKVTKKVLSHENPCHDYMPMMDGSNNEFPGRYGIMLRQPINSKKKFAVYDIQKGTIVEPNQAIHVPVKREFIRLMNHRLIKELKEKKITKEAATAEYKEDSKPLVPPAYVNTVMQDCLFLQQTTLDYAFFQKEESEVEEDNNSIHYFGDFAIDESISAITTKDAKQKFGDEIMHAKKLKEFQSIVDREVVREPREGDPKYTAILRVNGHFEEKPDQNKELSETLKFRACLDGSKTSVTKKDSASPTARSEHITAVMCAGLHNGMIFNVGDVNSAFLQANTNYSNDEHYGVLFNIEYTKIMLEIKPEWKKYVNKKGEMVLPLNKAWYGTKEAALWFYQDISCYLISTMGYTQMKGDPCIFVKTVDGKQSILVLFVDDILFVGSNHKLNQHAREQLERKYGPLKWQEGNQLKYLGQRIIIDYEKKEMRIDQTQYIDKMAAKYPPTRVDKTPSGKDFFQLPPEDKSQILPSKKFKSMIMSVSYLAHRTFPEVLKEIGFLSTRQQQPTISDYEKAQRVINYVHYRKDRPLILSPKDMKMSVYADAAFAIHIPDLKSHGGMVAMLGGAPILNKSKKLVQRCTSSCHAETSQLFLAKTTALALHSLLKEINFAIPVEDTPIFYQDNQSTIRLTEPGYHNPSARSKNFAIQYLDIREAVERKDIIVTYLPTTDMLADLHTKPLQGRLFRKFRNLLIGVPTDIPSAQPIPATT